MGNVLPARLVTALSVLLYGMFLAIIVPPAKKNLVIMISVLISFAASYACTKLPFVSNLSGGTRTIILTVVISSIVALIKPISDSDETKENETQEEE